MRRTFEGKSVRKTPALASPTSFLTASFTPASYPVKAGFSMFVESESSSATPSSPRRSNVLRSNASGSPGAPTLKSDVWTSVPTGVRMTMLVAWGMEWFTPTVSTTMPPSSNGPPSLVDTNSGRQGRSKSAILSWTSLSVKSVP
jgi:hypothetical protein